MKDRYAPSDSDISTLASENQELTQIVKDLERKLDKQDLDQDKLNNQFKFLLKKLSTEIASNQKMTKEISFLTK